MPALPLFLEPHSDETWHSYLTRRAAQHHVTTAALAEHIGIRDRRHRWPPYYGVKIDPERARELASELGLTAPQIQQMHLSWYDGRALDFSGLQEGTGISAVSRTALASWVYLGGSRYCPSCLRADGAWQLTWRIPWITVCLEHNCRLEWKCPGCGGIPGLYNATLHASAPSRSSALADGRKCDLPHPTSAADACSTDLSEVVASPAQPDHRQVAANFNELIDTGTGPFAGQPFQSLQVLRGWQAAIGIAIHLGVPRGIDWGKTHRWGAPPRDPAVLDALLAYARPLTQAPDTGEGAAVLRDWCARAGIRHPHRDTFRRATRQSEALEPVIASLLLSSGRASTRVQRIGAAQRDQLGIFPFEVADVPQVMWPCALPESLRMSTKPDALLLRVVLSMMLARMLSGGTWADSAVALGLPEQKAKQWARYASSTAFPNLHSRLLERLEPLSALLPSQPKSGRWAKRPTLDGARYGLLCLRGAQRPACRREDLSADWCPCVGQESLDEARHHVE